MAGDTEMFWQDIEITVDPDPLCALCQISTMNKKSISKPPLNPKTSFKWVLMEIIPATYSKSLIKDTTFDNYLLIVDAYYKI